MLDANDLVYPYGEIQPGWFMDGEDVVTIISDWIGQLDAGTSDAAGALLIKARCYTMIADRLASMPIDQNYGGQGGRSERFDMDQIRYWRDLAKEAAAEAEAIDAEEDDPIAGPELISTTEQVTFAW